MSLIAAAAADPDSTITKLALFAGVIGVATGWVLGELTKAVKWLAEGRQRRKAEIQTRILEFIHTAELISTTGNGLSTAYAAAASGRPVTPAQVQSLADQFNEAVVALNRLRLEVAILGPKWAQTDVVAVENGTLQLMTAMTDAERKKSTAAFEALIAEIDRFRDTRDALIKTATTEIGTS